MRHDVVLNGADPAANGAAAAPFQGPDPDAADEPKLRWDALYGGILAATVLLVVFTPFPLSSRIYAAAALLAMVPWYVAFIRPNLFPCESSSLRRLVGVFVLFTVATSLVPHAWFLAFGLVPLCFHATPFRSALTAAIGVNVVAALLTLPRMMGDLTQAVLPVSTAVFGVALSIGYGTWIQQIMKQSAERADLVERLAATRADLAKANHAAGVLAERQRLAGDIHDTLAQAFTSMVMLTEAVEHEFTDAPENARRQLRLIARTARDGLAESRALVAALRPPQLHEGNLDNVLRELTERIGAELAINAHFETTGSTRPLPADTEIVLLRTGQEALANIRKHAKANDVRVRLLYEGDVVRLEIVDDGIGFDPAIVNGGYGLRGMRARLSDVGGQVGVRSGPGQGTTVCAEISA
jgi:signal transduction histidine kinase